MGDEFALWFLGLVETTQYTLEQSHGFPPGSVVLDNTTLGGAGSCGYPELKNCPKYCYRESLVKVSHKRLQASLKTV